MNVFNEVHDAMELISQPYPETVQPQQKERKSRGRRRKTKAESRVGGMKKRKLNPEQVSLLEHNFCNEHKLESERKDKLASELGLDPRQVAVWFQNRRARYKYKKMEEEYSKLRTLHESVVLEKRHLESQILNMKKQLSEAQKEIQRLSLKWTDGISSGSPMFDSTLMHVPFLRDFEFQGIDQDALYRQEIHYNLIHGLEMA